SQKFHSLRYHSDPLLSCQFTAFRYIWCSKNEPLSYLEFEPIRHPPSSRQPSIIPPILHIILQKVDKNCSCLIGFFMLCIDQIKISADNRHSCNRGGF